MDWTPVAVAFEAVIVQWLQPLNVVLVVAIIMFARFMHKANQRPDFNLVDALRGPDGKASMKLIGYVVGIIAGTYVLFDCAASWLQQPMVFVYLFAIYMVLLIAPKIAAEWVQAKYSSANKDRDRGEPRKDA
jgi:hypothetical protein